MNPNRVFAPPALSDVLVEIHDSIATVTLNRPEQRNPLSASMTRDLKAALEWCRDEAGVAVVVLTGAGDRAFCAGADLSGFGADQSPLDLHRGRHLLADTFILMAELGKPMWVESTAMRWPVALGWRVRATFLWRSTPRHSGVGRQKCIGHAALAYE